MRRYTITEYDREDYEKLENMTCGEAIEELHMLYDMLFPPRSLKYDGTEEDYMTVRSSVALESAIRVLTESYKRVVPEKKEEPPMRSVYSDAYRNRSRMGGYNRRGESDVF